MKRRIDTLTRLRGALLVPSSRLLTRLNLLPLLLFLCLMSGTTAHAAVVTHVTREELAFAVVTDLPTSEAESARADSLLNWIGTHGKVAFILHLGNLKGSDEPCSDALFATRRAVLDQSPVPLVFIPGQADWVDCAKPAAGGLDPLERLDAIRDTFMGGSLSLGTRKMRLIRQSEQPAFRPYRENTRWVQSDIVFATLDVPADNNHFFDGGGRNGEYEDREIANRNWIARAATDARRRHARALVFFFQGDPQFAREPRNRLAWWFGTGRRERDGFAALRRDLVSAAHTFSGPVLIVHASPRASFASPVNGVNATHAGNSDRGFVVEPLLHTYSGKELHNMRRIEVSAPPYLNRWVRIEADVSRGNDAPASFHTVLEHAPTEIIPAPASGGIPGQNTISPPLPASSTPPPVHVPGGWPSSPTSFPGASSATAPGTSPQPAPASGTSGNSGASDSGSGYGDASGAQAYPPSSVPDDGDADDESLPQSPVFANITTPTLLPLPPLTPPASSTAAGAAASKR